MPLEKVRGRFSGYSLIEILFVITLFSIVVYLIASAYLKLGKEAKVQRITIQQEREIGNLQVYLRKLLGSIGFGIEKDKLNVGNVGCTDNNLDNFRGQSAVIGIAKDCNVAGTPPHDRLYFRTLYGSGEEKAGCWWVVDKNRNFISKAVDKFGRACEVESNDQCIFFDYEKNNMGVGSCNDPSLCNQPPCFAYYLRDQNSPTNPPEVFRIHLAKFEADDLSQWQRCANGSAKLMLQRQWNIDSNPLFDCVGGLRFKLEPDETNPRFLRVCLLLQVSGRFDAPVDVQNNSSCGSFSIRDDWKYYRWRVIEEVIPLRNLIE
ncbi:MAG: type II secretion system protein [Caldimicrobium sp.]